MFSEYLYRLFNRQSLDQTALCVLEGGEHVVGRDVAAANVAQLSVVGLADHRVNGQHILVARQCQHVADQRVRCSRHAYK